MIEWNEALDIISKQELSRFYRSPEIAEKYAQAKVHDDENYGGLANYVAYKQLKWDDLDPANPEFLKSNKDIKITRNRYPYYFEEDVVHLVVWTKVPIPSDSNGVTTEARKTINEFIDSYFVKKHGIARENLAWFKNPVILQTIPSIAHFHVLVRGSTHQKIEAILNDSVYI